MKKEYMEPMLEVLRLEVLQPLMGISDLKVDPDEETTEMDAKEAGDWVITDWE